MKKAKTTIVDNTRFEVAYLWTEEAYIVHRGGLCIGQPIWFSKKETAQNHADHLNAMHGLGDKNEMPRI